jgi:ketosteroid isomerase-like protein
MQCLNDGDTAGILALFADDGRVVSPFLGDLPAREFFPQLANATARSDITPIDVFLSADDQASAVAYFRYDWHTSDGTLITFNVMDLFTFAPGSDKVMKLDLIYDTHPIRSAHGNKYES